MKKSMAVLSMLLVCLWSINTFGDEPVPVKDEPWTISGLGMQFVYVAPGTFQMGSNNGGADEKPVHAVTISKGYWIGKYEVTQDEYQAIIGSNPSTSIGGRKPVQNVRWNDAVSFCQKLTERERAAGRLPSGYEYQLPTEAQWEFAARGGSASKSYMYSGGDNLDSVGWYEPNSSSVTHEVGTKSPNEKGIHDMSGNVWEWCRDWKGEYSGDSVVDPAGPASGSDRVRRGGCWRNIPAYCRVAGRYGSSPDSGGARLGFRVVLAPSAK